MSLSGGFIITGAASGIGAAIAKSIANINVELVLHTHSNTIGLEEVAQECINKGAIVFTFTADLSDLSQTNTFINSAKSVLKKINGVVSNAGFPDWRNFEYLPVEGFMKSVNLMQQSNFMILSSLAQSLIETRGGFIGISSFLAHKMIVGENINPASASAKAGLEALFKSFAAQYAAQGVRCNVIVPGYIKKDSPEHIPLDDQTMKNITNQIPLARLGTPVEVANLAEFLLSDKSKYITGQSIHIDGGLLL